MKNKETYELLSDYPKEQVDAALKELNYPIDAAEFPDSIIEEIEVVLEAVGGAVSHQKQLQSAGAETQREAIVPQDAGAIAAEAKRILNAKNIQTDNKLLLAVIQARINTAIEEATAINQVGWEVFVAELNRGKREQEQELIEAVSKQRSGTAAVLSATNLDRMVSRAVPNTPELDIDGFVTEVRSGVQSNLANAASRTRNQTEAAQVSQDFDLEGFLTEVYG